MAIVHLTSDYAPSDLETVRRHKVAAQSWAKQRWIEFPVGDMRRMWREEGVSLPYVRDLFDAGCIDRDPKDIIIYTNRDICVRSDCAVIVATHLQNADACYGYRMDFGHRLERPPTDAEFSQGRLYPGSDIVAFRVSWWKTNRMRMPDMLIGREATDPVLRVLIDETNRNTAPNDLPIVIAHERHGSALYWEHPDNRYRLKGQFLNLIAAKKFFTQRKINPAQFGIRGV